MLCLRDAHLQCDFEKLHSDSHSCVHCTGNRTKPRIHYTYINLLSPHSSHLHCTALHSSIIMHPIPFYSTRAHPILQSIKDSSNLPDWSPRRNSLVTK